MSTFSDEWLALREPLDALSRAAGLSATLTQQRSGPRRSLAVVDLGAGTGANLRYLAPRLGGQQDWLLVEHDPLLSAAIAQRMRAWAPQVSTDRDALLVQDARFSCRMRVRPLDLSADLQALPLSEDVLLTASALLDLVSEEWLKRLIHRAAGVRATVLFALSFDGQMELEPPEPEDAEVRALFNRHQRGDKGFGAALGATAASRAAQLLRAHGYRVTSGRSDWQVTADQPLLQAALLEGWCAAAGELAPERMPALRSWLSRRREHLRQGRLRLRVGHVDIRGEAPET